MVQSSRMRALSSEKERRALEEQINASLNGQIIAPGTILWQSEIADGEHPLVLAQNEGFSIRSVAVPATGTWQVSVDVQWAEVTAY